MEKGFRNIFLVAGVIIAGIGGLVIWRGMTEMIPKTGLAHGGLFTLGGVVFLLLGLGFIVVPLVKERRNAKKKQEHSSHLQDGLSRCLFFQHNPTLLI